MRRFRSIRWRLQLWYGLLLFMTLTGFGTTAYHLESGRQLRRMDEELRRLLPVLVSAQHPVRGDRDRREFDLPARDAALFDRPGDDPVYYVVWLRHSDRPVTRSTTAPRDVPQPRAGEPTTRQRGIWRETFLFPGPGDVVLVGRPVIGDRIALRQFAWGLAAAGAAVMAIGLVIGAGLVGRALRPIQDIGAAAQRIATGDLTQRIGTGGSGSELDQLAAVLDSTFARLDAAFTQQARFTADAAHELRTPVAIVLTHAQNGLAGTCPDPGHREAFEAIQRAAQRMRRLIGSLLELARFESGQEPLQRVEFDLAVAVADCLELLQPLAAERGIRLHSQLTASLYRGDADRMAQVVSNLLINAIEYNHPGGEIRVTTRRTEHAVELGVWNTGPSIPAEDLPHIFERFRRVDRSRDSSGHGGLGLAIAKSIVQAHGGVIAVRSDPEDGTIFTVSLPA